MHKIYIKNGLQRSNPLASVLMIIAGAIVITIFLVLGFFAFIALSAAVLVAASVFAIRSWWTGRNTPDPVRHESTRNGEFIEGEFHVVKRDKNS